MNGSLSLMQRWEFRSAIKTGKKTDKQDLFGSKSGLLFIAPSDAQPSSGWLPAVEEWLKNKPEWPLSFILPRDHVSNVRQVFPLAQIESYTVEEISKRGIPRKECRQRLAKLPASISILLSNDLDTISDTLFAMIDARLKIAFYHEYRQEYADFLVRPQFKTGHTQQFVQMLLEQLNTFDPDGILSELQKV